MPQIKVLFNALCYNLAMSENKSAMYSELSHPHAGDPRVDPKARGLHSKPTRRMSSVAKERRRLERESMGSGFFDSAQPIEQIPQPITPETPAIVERALRFEQGAPMYEVRYDNRTGGVVIPRTEEQADAMFIGRLPMSLELKIDKTCLERGKRGGTVIKRVGKSLFGAFTIALYPTIDEDGREIDLPVLADMRDRRLKKYNEVLRFRRETQGQPYFLSSPRISRRRAS